VSRAEPLIRNISDTALLTAVYRARETERPDALFRDPLAQRLAGERGERIAAGIPFSDHHTWSWVTRTYLFDQFIAEQLRLGLNMVVNLAAGLDTRPYRMALPASLTWIEVDLPGLLSYKEEVLGSEKPACSLERVRLDLSDAGARRELFGTLGRRAGRTLVITEGLIIYFTADEVGSLARDLAAAPGFQRWVFDLVSPGLLKVLQRKMGPQLERGGSPLKFGPREGPEFFLPHGWRPLDVRSMCRTTQRLERLRLWMRLLGLLPDPKELPGPRPWGGVCLFAKSGG